MNVGLLEGREPLPLGRCERFFETIDLLFNRLLDSHAFLLVMFQSLFELQNRFGQLADSGVVVNGSAISVDVRLLESNLNKLFYSKCFIN